MGDSSAQLRYSNHARKRMAERGIHEEDVAWALRRPAGSPEAGEPGTIWLPGYAASGRILRVCVRTTDREYIVTLAWRDEGGR